MGSEMKLLFVITEDWFFVSHFLERAVAARDAGYAVAVATRLSQHEELIRGSGIVVFPIEFSRRGMNPFVELQTAFKLRSIVKRWRPSIIHNIALKPVVTGTLGEYLAGHRNIINAPVGMGYVFTSREKRVAFVRPFIRFLIRTFLNPVGSQVVIENPDDYSALLENRLVRKEDLNLIKGAGVNVEVFTETPEPDGPLTVVLIARMLRDKGVGEFVESARQLKPRFPEVRFLLVGSPDLGNPTSFSISDLNSWQREECVEWIGHSSEVANILKQSHIVCLPSYREGLPKSLIEAASVGRPIVTTDVPGCREVVTDGENGFLVPPRDSVALADAIQKLLINPRMRKAMGAAGRKRAIEEFSSAVIIRQTLDLYESILIP